MAYEGITLRPFWVGTFFVLSIISAIFIWLRGFALVPLTFTGLAVIAMFWRRERRMGKAGWAFGGVLAFLAAFYSWIFINDLLPRDIWSCEREIRRGLENPKSYERVTIRPVETESLPEISVWTIRYRFSKNGTWRFGEASCYSGRFQEGEATLRGEIL